MDWADDTAYSLNDLTDSIRAGFLTRQTVETWAAEQDLDAVGREAVEAVLETIRAGDVEMAISRQIGAWIGACRLRERQNFMSDRTHRYRIELVVDPLVRGRSDWYRRLTRDLVFRSARLQQLEFKGRRMLERIFQAYREIYVDAPRHSLALLPEHRDQAVRAEPDPGRRARLVCDYLAGMTDGYAVRTYKRLFSPEFGSIVDIV
jgi:dGTPase